MRNALALLTIPLILGLAACQTDSGNEDHLPVLYEAFPEVPQPGGTQTFEVAPCYKISLAYDMQKIDVQGIDSNIAEFESDSTRVSSDCGAYDTDSGSIPLAQQDVVIEGFAGTLTEYELSTDDGDQFFDELIVLHLTRPGTGGFTGIEHLNIAVRSFALNDFEALAILASVRDVWL